MLISMTSLVKKATKLSHKCFRKLLKKFRRKKNRQLLAKHREEQEIKEQKIRESAPGYWEKEAERERNAKLWEEFEEREREGKHRLWLLREAEAQDEFRRKKQQQEKEKIKREEERKRILAEIEEKQLLENATVEKNKKEKQKKEVNTTEPSVMLKFLVVAPVLSDSVIQLTFRNLSYFNMCLLPSCTSRKLCKKLFPAYLMGMSHGITQLHQKIIL